MIISVIGSRPQYIKVKPIQDYCKENKINHIIIDSNQHYDEGMSLELIRNLDLSISYNLHAGAEKGELPFISYTVLELSKVLKGIGKPMHVLVYGDTNTSFAAALTCYKLGINFSHIEAGLRCYKDTVPEEINRIFCDHTANLCFCPSKMAMSNFEVGKHSMYTGDLEYEYLNSLDLEEKDKEHCVLTVHRKGNDNPRKIEEILAFCKEMDMQVYWPVHHRIYKNRWFDDIPMPNNVTVLPPLHFHNMYNLLMGARIVITDSGGLEKIGPFFGCKTLLLRHYTGWHETLMSGYSRIMNFTKADYEWAKMSRYRNKDFYLVPRKKPSKLIIDEVLEYENFAKP